MLFRACRAHMYRDIEPIMQLCCHSSIQFDSGSILGLNPTRSARRPTLLPWDGKAFWLLDIHGFVKGAIKECGVDVHLMDFCLSVGKYGEESSNGGILCHRGISLIMVFPPPRCEPL